MAIMKHFSTSWKASKQPRKQRKYRANAPLHIKKKFANAHLGKDLKKKFGKRTSSLRKGDKVIVLRGSFKKREGKIEKIDLKKTLVFVNGIESTKRDGSKRQIGLHPSNLVIVELTDDKTRQKALERK